MNNKTKHPNDTASIYVGVSKQGKVTTLSEFSNIVPGATNPYNTYAIHTIGDGNSDAMVSWDYAPSDNSFPRKAIDTLYSDKDVPSVLRGIVGFLLGDGQLATFFVDSEGTKTKVNVPEITNWLNANKTKLRRFLLKIATDFTIFDNYFVQYAYDKDGKIVDFAAMDPNIVRLGRELSNNGRSKTAYLLPINHNGITTGETKTLPTYKDGEQYKNQNVIFHGGGYTPTQPYYSIPLWVGGITNLGLREKIMAFYNNTLDNGFNIKFVIEIHPKYYENIGATTKELKDAAKADLSTKIEDFFRGTQGASRSIIVDTVADNIQRTYSGLITIKPVDNTLSDSQFAELLKQTDGNTPVNFGLDATLAGFTKQGMGASGSDTLYKYLFHMAVKMPLNRSMVLEAIEILFANFGWWAKYANDFNQIGFVDAQIMRQSDNHTGLTNSIAQ